MPRTTTYRIVKSTGFYPQLNVLLIALQGMAIAANLRSTGRFDSQPGDYLTIQAKHLRKEVRLPLVGPVETALLNRKPDEVHVTLVHEQTTCCHTYSTDGFADFVDAIFLPFLVSYYEQHLSEIKVKYGTKHSSWPASWQMAKVLRNATSHAGRAFTKTAQQAVSWSGLTFGPSDEPAKSILSLVNGADILILFLEMEEARTSISLNCA